MGRRQIVSILIGEAASHVAHSQNGRRTLDHGHPVNQQAEGARDVAVVTLFPIIQAQSAASHMPKNDIWQYTPPRNSALYAVSPVR